MAIAATRQAIMSMRTIVVRMVARARWNPRMAGDARVAPVCECDVAAGWCNITQALIQNRAMEFALAHQDYREVKAAFFIGQLVLAGHWVGTTPSQRAWDLAQIRIGRTRDKWHALMARITVRRATNGSVL